MKKKARIWRKSLCIGMAVVMAAAFSVFPARHTPTARAEGEDVVLSLSSLQFDGDRYYFMLNMVAAGYVSVTAQIFVNSDTDQVANEIQDAGIAVDTSVFPESFIGCPGFNECDTKCN